MRHSANEEQADKLETQLKEDKFTMAESERRFEDIARKLATMEGELERSNDRCSSGEIIRELLNMHLYNYITINVG